MPHQRSNASARQAAPLLEQLRQEIFEFEPFIARLTLQYRIRAYAVNAAKYIDTIDQWHRLPLVHSAKSRQDYHNAMQYLVDKLKLHNTQQLLTLMKLATALRDAKYYRPLITSNAAEASSSTAVVNSTPTVLQHYLTKSGFDANIVNILHCALENLHNSKAFAMAFQQLKIPDIDIGHAKHLRKLIHDAYTAEATPYLAAYAFITVAISCAMAIFAVASAADQVGSAIAIFASIAPVLAAIFFCADGERWQCLCPTWSRKHLDVNNAVAGEYMYPLVAQRSIHCG